MSDADARSRLVTMVVITLLALVGAGIATFVAGEFGFLAAVIWFVVAFAVARRIARRSHR